jgi:hypothetical protein
MLTFVAANQYNVSMKRIVSDIWLTVILAICGTMKVQAQKIQVVDKEGKGIALASVMDGNGVLIGLTDLNGVLADVKGATDHGYMTEDEFKQKCKDINALNSTRNYLHMPLEDLEAYERQHNIPAISDEVRKAISLITRDRWK